MISEFHIEMGARVGALMVANSGKGGVYVCFEMGSDWFG